MNIFDFFHIKDSLFTPKTPNSAFKAVTLGVVPKEYFIFISNFIYSPFETPGKLKILTEDKELKRLNELERILAKEKLDLESEVLLIFTLEKLGKHSNPEIALFAAESINSIEDRYNRSIYELKKKLEVSDDIESITKIIKLYYNYGYINKSKEDIRLFYYKEALNFYRKLDRLSYINTDLLFLRIKLLNQLNCFNESRTLLENFKDILSDSSKVLLSLEIEFEDRNFDKLISIINSVDTSTLDEFTLEVINQWKDV